jgi:hypothetical protein
MSGTVSNHLQESIILVYLRGCNSPTAFLGEYMVLGRLVPRAVNLKK